jgi:hypothetical protein
MWTEAVICSPRVAQMQDAAVIDLIGSLNKELAPLEADSMISSHSLAKLGVILIAGLTSGALDITCALALNKLRGTAPTRTLQGIASGLLGAKSFEGGRSTAALGLGLHFLIAVVAAAGYYIASREIGALIEYSVLCGLVYGIVVHLFMSFIVLPLSSLQRPFSGTFFAAQLVIHMFFVGLPISLIVRHFA